MRQFLEHALVLLVCSGVAAAQGVPETMAVAQEHIDAGEWTAALDLLLGLMARVGTDPERELIAAKMDVVGIGLEQKADFVAALRACEAALAVQKILHSERDHHAVARSLNDVASCLDSLGQANKALPQYEAGLAMRRRLHGNRDHADAADSLNNVAGCRLVVLSACRTNVGPLHRDEAPPALPLGFLFAGAPAVISSLWTVDDASTRELMTDFYGRLAAGEADRLKAFTAAKKMLREKYRDPFHWAPFVYMGIPE